MPRNELRISGLLQAAVVALVLGALFRHTPATAPRAIWPYVLGGYAALAVTMPWLAGGLARDEFSLRLSTSLGVVFALPLCVSAYWLSSSPYRTISLGCWALATLWGVHFVVSIVCSLRK